ncbi:MAG: glycerate kinase, partial [Alphaproteobacteria bacterium]
MQGSDPIGTAADTALRTVPSPDLAAAGVAAAGAAEPPQLRVLIAPSGFKEGLSAEAVCSAIAAGVRQGCPGAETDCLPFPDGGERLSCRSSVLPRGFVP